MVNATYRPLYLRKDPVPIVQEAGWAPGPVWTGAENLAPTGIRSTDLPSRSSVAELSWPLSTSYIPCIKVKVNNYTYFCTLRDVRCDHLGSNRCLQAINGIYCQLGMHSVKKNLLLTAAYHFIDQLDLFSQMRFMRRGLLTF